MNVQFANLGLTNISFWFGLNSILSPQISFITNVNMQNVNFTFGFNFNTKYNSEIQTYYSSSDTYPFTIKNIHDLSLTNNGYGILNSNLVFSNDY